jgi:gas vesicle protein
MDDLICDASDSVYNWTFINTCLLLQTGYSQHKVFNGILGIYSTTEENSDRLVTINTVQLPAIITKIDNIEKKINNLPDVIDKAIKKSLKKVIDDQTKEIKQKIDDVKDNIRGHITNTIGDTNHRIDNFYQRIDRALINLDTRIKDAVRPFFIDLMNSIDNLLFAYFQGFYASYKQLLETSLEDLYKKLEEYLVVIRREINRHTDTRVNRAVRDINGHLDDKVNTLKTDINSHIDDSVTSATTSINNNTNNKIQSVESKVDAVNTLLGTIDELLTALSVEIGIMSEAIATNFFTIIFLLF